MKWHKHPGVKPTHLNKRGAFELFRSDDLIRQTERDIAAWEAQYISWAMQDMKITKAIEKEEKRQENMDAYSIDPVKATTELHRRKGLLNDQ